MTQVFLTMTQHWADIIEECDTFILAKDLDGVMVYVIKDGQQKVRTQDE